MVSATPMGVVPVSAAPVDGKNGLTTFMDALAVGAVPVVAAPVSAAAAPARTNCTPPRQCDTASRGCRTAGAVRTAVVASRSALLHCLPCCRSAVWVGSEDTAGRPVRTPCTPLLPTSAIHRHPCRPFESVTCKLQGNADLIPRGRSFVFVRPSPLADHHRPRRRQIAPTRARPPAIVLAIAQPVLH